MPNKKNKKIDWSNPDRKIDWTNAIAKAERQLGRNKAAIESSVMGTPSNWSRPNYNKPMVAPDQSPPDEKVKKPKKLSKKQRRAHNKVFVPQQKQKAKRSTENQGLPIVKKVNQ
jgi:hypothetical protein